MIKTAIKRVLVCAALTGFGAGASSVMAAMETFTAPISATLIASTPGSLVASVPQFDPSLGTLTGVSIEADTSSFITAEVIDFGTAGTYTGAFSNTTVTLTDPYNNSLTSSVFVSSGPSGNGSIAAGTPSTPTYVDIPGSLVALAALVNSSVPSANFAAFTGLGSASINYTATEVDYMQAPAQPGASSGGTSLSGGVSPPFLSSLFFGSEGVTYSGTETVIYTYTALPEPSSLGLLGVGVMALIRRRRNA